MTRRVGHPEGDRAAIHRECANVRVTVKTGIRCYYDEHSAKRQRYSMLQGRITPCRAVGDTPFTAPAARMVTLYGALKTNRFLRGDVDRIGRIAARCMFLE